MSAYTAVVAEPHASSVPDGFEHLPIEKLRESSEARRAVVATLRGWFASVDWRTLQIAIESEARVVKRDAADAAATLFVLVDRLRDTIGWLDRLLKTQWTAQEEPDSLQREHLLRALDDFDRAIHAAQRIRVSGLREVVAGIVDVHGVTVGHVRASSGHVGAVEFLTDMFGAVLRAATGVVIIAAPCATLDPAVAPRAGGRQSRGGGTSQRSHPDQLDEKDWIILTELANGPKTSKDLAGAIGIKAGSIPSRMEKLKRLGLFEGNKPYRITDAGHARLNDRATRSALIGSQRAQGAAGSASHETR